MDRMVNRLGLRYRYVYLSVIHGHVIGASPLSHVTAVHVVNDGLQGWENVCFGGNRFQIVYNL